MKQMFFIILAGILVFASVSCTSSEPPKVQEETAGNPDKAIAEGNEENPASPADTPETQEEPASPADNPETEEDPDDFQKGIPAEYRLKRNIKVDLDEPLPPPPEGAPEATFFSLMTAPGGSGTDIGPLFKKDDIEKFFGMELDEKESTDVGSVTGNAILFFAFKPPEGTESGPNVRITYSIFATEEDAEEGYEMVNGDELEGIGKKARVMDFFGTTWITILTDKNELFYVTGYGFENQEELMLNYVKDLMQRLDKLSKP